MYNRYVPGSGGYTRVVVDEGRHTEENKSEHRAANHSSTTAPTGERRKNKAPFADVFGGEDKNAGIAGILKSLHLDGLDSGDILLLLIILLVFLEGDNMELVITLGLMLLLGLGEDGKKTQNE